MQNGTLIARIVDKLAAEYSPEQIVLFGSHASGTADSESDIDLLIIKKTSEKLIERWATVRRILSGPERTVPLDTLVLTPEVLSDRLAVGDQFIKEILQKGRVLYAA